KTILYSAKFRTERINVGQSTVDSCQGACICTKRSIGCCLSEVNGIDRAVRRVDGRCIVTITIWCTGYEHVVVISVLIKALYGSATCSISGGNTTKISLDGQLFYLGNIAY